MTIRSGSAADGESRRFDGRGLVFWYQATRLARASASCRYRIGHFAELLRGATAIVDPKPPLAALAKARTLVVVRPYLDDGCLRLLDACRDRGVRLVADFDDLLFAGDPADYPLVLSGAMSEGECADRIARYRAGLSVFDAFTVATEALRDRLSDLLPDAEVVWTPNGLSTSWVRQGRALYPTWRPGEPRVLRFLAGSPSHDADFAEVVGVLGEFLRARPDVRLQIIGPVKVQAGHLPSVQVAFEPLVPYLELPRLLASSWLTIAPLRSTAFTACKSAIKFLESAAFGAPCIATSSEAAPWRDATRHREGGILLAGDESEWWRELNRMMDDGERMALGRRSRIWVDEHGGADRGARRSSEWSVES